MRPTGKRCSKCIRELVQCPGHLENAYDHAMLRGMSEQDLIEYACNRMLALDRDNGNKAAGEPAKRVYKSRNTVVASALATRCHVRERGFQCMRPAGHEGAHKF